MLNPPHSFWYYYRGKVKWIPGFVEMTETGIKQSFPKQCRRAVMVD